MTVMEHSRKDTPLRLASYNIRKARGLDGRRDPGRVLDVINALGADVITLQEADHRLGERPAALPKDLIAQATDFDIVPLASNDVSLGWHGNAVLVRRGLAISGARQITLPGAEPRGAVCVTLENDLTIVGVHLGLLRHSRRRQLKSIVADLDPAKKVAIIGDMNEWAVTRGFEALQDGFTVYSPGRSFHSARPIAALDRLALSNGVTLADAGVDQRSLTRIASDHLPIWADII